MGISRLDIYNDCCTNGFISDHTSCKQFTEERFHHQIKICKDYKPTNIYV